MRTTKRRANRDRLTPRTNSDLPDGVGGTITGGPMEPIDVMEILARGARGVSGAGAVSGAAQVVVSGVGPAPGKAHGIALSDGSRISFTSIVDTVILDEEVRVATGVVRGNMARATTRGTKSRAYGAPMAAGVVTSA
jgi:hypothetical protein